MDDPRGHRRRSPHQSTPPPAQKFWTRLKDCCRTVTAFLFSHIGVCVLVVAYAVLGGFLFPMIESSVPPIKFENLTATRRDVILKMWTVTKELNVFDKETWSANVTGEIKRYADAVVEAVSDGYDGEDERDLGSAWSFPAAFLYSLAVITTIGYGNLAPQRVWGKMATVLYGLVGMPLFLLYLSNIGDFLAAAFRWLYARCCLCRYGKKRHSNRSSSPSSSQDGGKRKTGPDGSIPLQVVGGEEEIEEEKAEEEVAVPIHVSLVLMVTYVVGGARLFSIWEDWDLLDGSYFCFISLSTIGFGDLVPGDKIYAKTGGPGDAPPGVRLAFVFCSLYLLMGMALIAMCFNLMQEQVVRGVKNCIHRLSCRREKKSESENA